MSPYGNDCAVWSFRPLNSRFMCMGHQYSMQHDKCLIDIVFLATSFICNFSPEKHLNKVITHYVLDVPFAD